MSTSLVASVSRLVGGTKRHPQMPVLKGSGGREVLWVQGSEDRETGPGAHPLGGQGLVHFFSTNS